MISLKGRVQQIIVIKRGKFTELNRAKPPNKKKKSN
jgi:hypothetical protein